MPANGSQSNEVDVSNQESRGGPGRMTDPQYPVAKGKRLKIVTSNAPVVAAKIKPKHTKKATYKRD